MEEDWNIDDYRAAHESEEHWMLRRQFMEANKDRFPRIRVLSLSQVFANVEFLGCRYPAETMELVAELSQGFVEEYRQKQKTRLQRTFVKASAAAEKKSKGEDTTANHSRSQTQGRPSQEAKAAHYMLPISNNFVSPTPQQPVNAISTYINTNSKPSRIIGLSKKRQNIIHHPSSSIASHTVKSIVTNILDSSLPSTNISSSVGVQSISTHSPQQPIGQINDTVDLDGLVLVEQLYIDDNPPQILNRSCSMSHKRSFFYYLANDERGFVCSFNIGKHFVVEGFGQSRDAAKQSAIVLSLDKLRQLCYTIQIKDQIVGTSKIGKQDLIDEVSESQQLAPTPLPQLEQNNIGNKLLRLMGWSGGALGKNEDGIKEAIDVSESIGRKRLGLGSTQFSRAGMINFLENHLATTVKEDVIFSNEFTPPEREVIHKAANFLGLKSRSYGKKEHRFLVVSRKICLHDLVQEILYSGETAKYRVIKPGEHEELIKK